MLKKLRTKRRWGTKKNKKEEFRHDCHVAVANWWSNKKSCGVLFGSPSFWREGVDYIGDLPWPDEISLKALYVDFVDSLRGAGPDMTKLEFAYWFRRTTGLTSTKNRDVSERKENNRVFIYSSSVFYPVGKCRVLTAP